MAAILLLLLLLIIITNNINNIRLRELAHHGERDVDGLVAWVYIGSYDSRNRRTVGTATATTVYVHEPRCDCNHIETR